MVRDSRSICCGRDPLAMTEGLKKHAYKHIETSRHSPFHAACSDHHSAAGGCAVPVSGGGGSLRLRICFQEECDWHVSRRMLHVIQVQA